MKLLAETTWSVAFMESIFGKRDRSFVADGGDYILRVTKTKDPEAVDVQLLKDEKDA